MQFGNFDEFPYGAHLSWKSIWHSWGNSQLQANAEAAIAFGIENKSGWINSAEREALGLYGRILTDGFIREFSLGEGGEVKRFPQISYDIRTITVGLIRLFEATSDTIYAKMAGIASSWFFGNNPVEEWMYDPETGRCFDGIDDSISINRNSGAESTIEALYTILEVGQYPIAVQYHNVKLKRRGALTFNGKSYPYAVYQNKTEEDFAVVMNGIKKSVEFVTIDKLNQYSN